MQIAKEHKSNKREDKGHVRSNTKADGKFLNKEKQKVEGSGIMHSKCWKEIKFNLELYINLNDQKGKKGGGWSKMAK